MTVLRPLVGDVREIGIEIEGVGESLPAPANDFGISPRVWLGYVTPSGLGVRARYWRFDQTLNAETGGVVGEISQLTAAGRLRTFAADAEVTQQFTLGLWKMNVGGGLRTAGTSRDFAIDATDVEQQDFGISYYNRFNGTGPTLFAELRRPIGESGFALVATGRGSLLFGTRRVGLATSEAVAVGDFTSLQIPTFGFREKHDSTVSVGEVQMGAEWSRQIGRGASLYVDVLWEGQIWAGSGGITNLVNDDVGFVGFTLSAGILR